MKEQPDDEACLEIHLTKSCPDQDGARLKLGHLGQLFAYFATFTMLALTKQRQ